MMSMNREKVTAVVLFIVSLLYIHGTYSMPKFEYVTVTPGRYYTYALGIMLILFSIILFFKNDISSRKWEPTKGKVKKIAVLNIILLAMLPIFSHLGLIVTFTIGSAVMSRYLGWRKWSTAFIVFGAINVTIYLLFTKVLGIYLPLGKWPEAFLSLFTSGG